MGVTVKTIMAVTVLLTLLMGLAHGQTIRSIGGWRVETGKDRFDDGRVITARVRGVERSLTVICHERDVLPPWLTLRISGGFVPGDLYKVKFRVDDGPVIDTLALGARGYVEISKPHRLVKQMLSGRLAVFRIFGDVESVDTVFRLGKAEAALEAIDGTCPMGGG